MRKKAKVDLLEKIDELEKQVTFLLKFLDDFHFLKYEKIFFRC